MTHEVFTLESQVRSLAARLERAESKLAQHEDRTAQRLTMLEMGQSVIDKLREQVDGCDATIGQLLERCQTLENETSAALQMERRHRRLDLDMIARHEHVMNLQEKDIARIVTLVDVLRDRLKEVITLTLDCADSTSDVGLRVREIRQEFDL